MTQNLGNPTIGKNFALRFSTVRFGEVQGRITQSAKQDKLSGSFRTPKLHPIGVMGDELKPKYTRRVSRLAIGRLFCHRRGSAGHRDSCAAAHWRGWLITAAIAHVQSDG